MKTIRIYLVAIMMIGAIATNAKTLVAYYSFTNHVDALVADLTTQIEADVVRIEPAEKGVDYAANGYALGSALISAIRSNPNDPSSYPAIDQVDVDMDKYDIVIVATPLWWSNMAAPMQSFLFQYGAGMAGKHIGLIVSSASSGISGVEADAKRLIPNGVFMDKSLWIQSAQTGDCHNMIAAWLNDVDYEGLNTGSVGMVSGQESARIVMTSEGISAFGEFERMTVYNAGGQKILETKEPTVSRHFPSGVYVVKLANEGRPQTIKAVVR